MNNSLFVIYIYVHVKCFALCQNGYIQGQVSWLSQKMGLSTKPTLSNKKYHIQQLWQIENFCLKMEASLSYKVAYAIVELLV